MSSPENQDAATRPDAGSNGTDTATPPPESWQEALLLLLSSRLDLIRLEARHAARNGSRRLVLVAASALAAFFIWALLLAGSLGALALWTGWPWWAWSFIAAAIHILAVIVMLSLAKKSGEEPFAITRAEFQKDREWIENLRKTKKSGN